MRVTHFMQGRLGAAFRYYRLAYNFIAVVTLVPVLWYMRSMTSDVLFQWTGNSVYVRYILLLGLIYLTFLALRAFDLSHLVGVRQVRAEQQRSAFVLKDTGILGMMRHPLYTVSLLVIWLRDITVVDLVVNCIVTFYLVLGTYLEERKLCAELGETYLIYQTKVSMFFPWKWLRQKLKI